MSMTSSEIRAQFIHFFSERGHAELASASLIPAGDPTLLFTNAGMVQFKSTFLGEEKRSYKRAVSSQKCVRAGGKHNDLENVGQTARHHTFFEMLGNFSFGDYFKEDAIIFAWDLLTKTYQLPQDKLFITVYKDDNEAEKLWRKIVPADRILRLGEKDNFWQMGDVGPCGPCSEIMFDQGEALHPDCPGIGHCECDRYLEIWNLVFMQYSRDLSGKLSPLPKPSIDTGMGLERITAVCQGVSSNYETDLFRPLFRAIAKESNRSEEEVLAAMPGRVIADHLRALTFLAADGLVPANEGRGYVFRRILRRAARFGRQFGFYEPFLHGLTQTLIDQMAGPYPELKQQEAQIKEMILGEEERFIHTLNQGVQLLDEVIVKLKKKGEDIIPGSDLFTLYDTYGFPVDLSEEIAVENNLKLDLPGFSAAMTAQKERARRSWVGADQKASASKTTEINKTLLEDHGKSDFVGYTQLESETPLLAIIKGDELVPSASAGDEVTLLIETTPFYAESGGQAGDRGSLSSNTALVQISRTDKVLLDLILHHGKVEQGKIEVGQTYLALVEPSTRHDTARNHTGTHLLHATLREVLGDHVKQAGSLVSPDRLRFDFQHFSPLNAHEIDRIEEEVNRQIIEGTTVETKIMDMKEAVDTGAMALFGEKYGDEVRVVSVGDFSSELCGGTHCGGVGEIGLFKIVKEGSVASGIRRIEALTGRAAYAWMKMQETCLQKTALYLKSRPDEVPQKTERLLALLQKKEQEIANLRKTQNGDTKDPLSSVQKIGTLSLLKEKIAPAEIKVVRARADHLRDLLQSGIIIVGAASPDGEKVSIVVMVTSDWTSRYQAGKIAKALAALIDGSGGGKPEMAQAGGKRADKLDAALAQSIEIIQGMS